MSYEATKASSELVVGVEYSSSLLSHVTQRSNNLGKRPPCQYSISLTDYSKNPPFNLRRGKLEIYDLYSKLRLPLSELSRFHPHHTLPKPQHSHSIVSEMFKTLNQEAPTSKCFLSSGSFPRFIDPKQPPTKRKPFSTIMSQPFNHRVGYIRK